jgi:hypothetical protein
MLLSIDLSIAKNSSDVEFVGLGRGRNDFGWKWEQTNEGFGQYWKQSDCHLVPYSHLEPSCGMVSTPFPKEQHDKLRDILGGLYTVPPNLRYESFFQAWRLRQQSWETAMERVSELPTFMKSLVEVGGSFTV